MTEIQLCNISKFEAQISMFGEPENIYTPSEEDSSR